MNNQNKQLIESLRIAQNKIALMVELAEKGDLNQVRVIDQLYIADVERMLVCAKLHCAKRIQQSEQQQ